MSKKGDKNQRIQVFARCRPLNSIEKKQCSASIVEVIPEKKEIVLKEKNTSRQFCFDKVFPPDTQQIAVYKAVVGPLIQEVLMGYNCTVFAYGQTGTGKTYTMEGERNNTKCSWEDDPGAGIIPRSLHQLFEELNKEENVEFSVRVSFLELYNEELFDLLSSTELSKLRLYEDTNRKGSVIIHGLEEILVNNKDEVYSILEKGTARRQTAATMLNATSSRSHTVFSVTVHIKENTVEGEELLKTGKLNLVDLAGSENVGRSGAIDKRAREAGNINQSLLTLGRVITALIEKQPHVPYRESKLTRLLQDSLGGHTKTSIIATISPAQCNSDETISTLDYATKAKSITIKPEVNQKMTKRALIREYTEEIERLRKELAAARGGNQGFFVDRDNYTFLTNNATMQENQIKELSDKIEAMTAELTKVEQMFTATKENLNYTQEVLSKTILEKNKKQYVINVQQNTGKQLLLQSKTILQVTDQITGDNEGLHAKVERQKTVEKTNEELFKDLIVLSQEQSATLCSMNADRQKEINELLQYLKQDQEKIKSVVNEHKQKTSFLHNSFTNEIQSLFDGFLNQLNEQANSERQWASNLSEDLSSKKDNFSLEIQTFMTQKLPSLLAQLNDVSISKDNWILDIHKSLSEKVTQHTHANKTQTSKEESLICEWRKSLESFWAQYDANMLDFKGQTQSFSKQKDKLDKILSDMANLREMMENTQIGATYAKFENNRAQLKPLDEGLNTMETNLKTREENEITHYTELSNIIKMDKFTQMKDSTMQCHKAVSSELVDFSESLQKLQSDSCQQAKAAVEGHSTTTLKEVQNNKSTVNNISTSFSNRMDEAKKCCEEDTESVENLSCKTIDFVSKVVRKNSETTSKLNEEMLKGDLEIEKFISQDLVRDIPTGTTPQRKTYNYPRELVAIPEYEQVIQRLNSQPSGDAIKLLLDSSFNETEESKSTISTSSAVNSHEASFTSEVNDSDGCESDSSTVSDISVDGKNKENKKGNKKSRLPKSLPKFNGFVKPAPISGRKPLHASNPDVNSAR